MRIRFLQFSDCHLDSKLGGLLGLSIGQQRQRQQELRAALQAAADLARKEQVHLVLVPGDMWDAEEVGLDTANFVRDEVFGRLHPIPVFVAPGNHDWLSPQSPYAPDYWRLRDQTAWPENVHIFASREFTHQSVPGLEGVVVTGMAAAGPQRVDQRLLAARIPRPEAEVNLLLFHGSRLSGAIPPDKETTAPFTDDELVAQGFHYTALGHYHSFDQIKDKDGAVRAAYSGCIAGRFVTEYGQKGVVLGEIDQADPRGAALQFVPIDQRQVFSVEVSVDGLTNLTQVKDAVDVSLRGSEAGERDMVLLRLKGRFLPGITLDSSVLLQEWEKRFWHLRYINQVTQDHDLSIYPAEAGPTASTEQRFVANMRKLHHDARSEEEKQIIWHAIHLGLDALRGWEISKRGVPE